MSKEKAQKRGERLQLMLTNDEVDAVDTWRFDHRMPSRSAAVRALVRLGLEAKVPPAEIHARALSDVSSDDIGILSVDPRVEAVLGGEDDRPHVAVFASDPIIGRGLRDILGEAGIDARPLLAEFQAVRKVVSDERTRPIVLALDDEELVSDEVGELVDHNDRLIVVCLGEVDASKLPAPLRGAYAVSRLSAPEVLAHSVRDLLSDDEEAKVRA